MDNNTIGGWQLRDLPVPTRLVIAVFMVSVGLGYFSGLVQLHFQHARAGSLLPGAEESTDAYHGKPRMSHMERLLTADESKPFNGSGTMRPAFTSQSTGWPEFIERATEEAIRSLRAEREGERLALIDWIRNGADAKSYEDDSYPLPEKIADHPFTEAYLVKGRDETPITPRVVKIKTLLEGRCVRCHKPGLGAAGEAPLDNYENVARYCVPEAATGMSLTKLAQTTHVHLLGFSMLFGLTGLVFTLTSYPLWARCLFGPFTLIAQVLDIGCWWLGRSHALFAQAVLVTGALVAAGLLVQILGSLFDLFGSKGKKVVALMLLLALAGAAGLHFGLFRPYLEREASQPEIRSLDRKALEINQQK